MVLYHNAYLHGRTNSPAMRKIVYYVARSLDGFICGPKDNIEGYVDKGSGLDQYLNDLKSFDTVIMGRRNYEFELKYRIVPGQPAYDHMEHFIFSNRANYDNLNPRLRIVPYELPVVVKLRNASGTDVYLCGGSIFAGWLLRS